tara:strand:+ start:3841 stop:4890 length:1050 start_codon:yes stop_codon:yes gene_type:complete
MSNTNVNVNVLNTSAPNNSAIFAEKVAYKYYAIKGHASLLACERDQIFMLKDAAGIGYVLRFTNPVEDLLVANFQTEAMLHVAKVDTDIPVPRIIKTIDDEAEVLVQMENGQTSLVRMISFLDGVPLSNVSTHSPEQRRGMAHNLARLDIALRRFHHPAEGHKLQWDLKHASGLRAMLTDIGDIEGRMLATQGLDAFERFALPVFPKLRCQVIHNDLNYSNVMVDEKDHNTITGIIDFGDMVLAPLINEVGVAAAYHVDDSDDPLALVAEFLATYHQVIPLESVELEILYDLIVARLVTTLVITESRAKQYPGNRDYILRNNQAARKGLKRLEKIGRDDGRAYLQDVCD